MKKFTSILFLCGCLLYAAAATAHAQSGTTGPLAWSITNGTLTISGTGAMPDYTSTGMPWYDYRNSITAVEIGSGVTSIGKYAFSDCDGLTFIEVASDNPNYSSENGVLFNKNKTLLIDYPCKKTATSYIIPNSVTAIGEGAFAFCDGLTSVTIPGSVTEIGLSAFAFCNGLTEITNYATTPQAIIFEYGDIFSGGNIDRGECVLHVPKGSLTAYRAAEVWKYFEIVKMGNINGKAGPLAWSFANGTLTISGRGAMPDYSDGAPWYNHRKSIAQVVIGNSVTGIGAYAFYECEGLTSVFIPQSVTVIGESAFSDCDGLTFIEVASDNPNYSSENGVLFNKNKTALIQYPCKKTATSYIIPNSVTTIENVAFSFSSDLTSIEATLGNASYSSENGVLFNKDKTALIRCPGGKTGVYAIPESVTAIEEQAFLGCSSLASVTIPESVTAIGKHAFLGCSSLASVTIPNSATAIGEHAFCGCNGLTSVTIPNLVTAIGEYAFSECSSLTSIMIPNSVTAIGEGAFFNCAGLTSVIIGNSVTAIGDYAFTNCSGLVTVTVSNSVTAIGKYAFYACAGLAEIVNHATTPQAIKGNVFNVFIIFSGIDKKNCVLRVPKGSLAAYRTARVWKKFKNIEAITSDVGELFAPV
ncbi:MAG: leucine-rich repeat domain-containing protein [Cytophagaceae bacterium]|nr:leucine-rich repeat domain-containing protein [Cytophagaceae bacterium]